MGIIQRFKDIMSSNVNAMLDKAEDPEKMVDQYLRNLNKDLSEVKSETASVMADEKRAKRELDECTEEIGKLQAYAEKAVISGNDADAKEFLTEKNNLMAKQQGLQQAYDVAAENSEKMREMHDKLEKDIASLNARRDSIKAKTKVAKTQKKVNDLTESVNGSSRNMDAFNRMEEKANRMLDEANAVSELNGKSASSSMSDLKMKYDVDAMSDVDDELAALKAQMELTEKV